MDTISRYLLENYSDTKLGNLLFVIEKMDIVETLYFWRCVAIICNESNAPIIAAYLIDATDVPIVFPRYAQRSLNYHIHQINKKLSRFLTKRFVYYVKQLKIFRFAKNEEVKSKPTEIERNTPNDFLIRQIFDILIRKTKVEIVNSIEAYFNINNIKRIKNNVLLYYLSTLGKLSICEAPKYITYITLLLNDMTPQKILEFLENEHPYSDMLMASIYLHNSEFYDSIVDYFYIKKRFYKVSVIKMLISYDVKKITFNSDNLDIIGYILSNRPKYLDDTVEQISKLLHNDVIAQLFIDYYDILMKYIRIFNFSFENLKKIANSKPDFIEYAYRKAQNEKEKYDIYSILITQDDDFILKFIQDNEDGELVNYILSNKPLKHDLKNYILSKYGDDEKYVCKLLPYLENEAVFAHINKYLVDESSLKCFLTVLKPSEIIIFAHNLDDLKKAMRIVDLCMESEEVTDEDFMYALNAFEDKMPPLVVRTLILTLKKYPHVKSWAISYLLRLINKGALDNDSLKNGVIKMLEMLNNSSIEVFLNLEEHFIYKILQRSKRLYKICEGYIHNNDCRNNRSLYTLRNVLYNRKIRF